MPTEPATTSRWILHGQKGIDCLQLEKGILIRHLEDTEVLVHIHAASLNHRDLAIAQGVFSSDTLQDVVPSSDGAGIVVAVGANVNSFHVGDRVVTHMTPHLPADTPPEFLDIRRGMGQNVDGTLRTHGIFAETALVRMPSTLDFDQASTLSCSGLTAFNALFGLPSHAPTKGSWVLVQGTGGVSVAALQFAVAAGANVIATTSSKSKKKRLEELGAKHVLNYRADARWGETAKGLTPGKRGLDLVVDVGGLSTLGQSLKAVRVDGLVSACGLLGKTPEGEETPSIMTMLMSGCTLRGVLLGSRTRFEEMCKWIDEFGVQPMFDDRIFSFEEVKEAYHYVEEQKHFSKVVIRVASC